MAAAHGGSCSTFHLVAVPYPGRGHINPMMNLCKLLLASPMMTANRSFSITFVVTEEWVGLMGSDSDQICPPEAIRLETIPNVLPSEKVRANIMHSFLDAVMYKMGEPFERLLDRLEIPATAIIADTFLHWAVDIGNRRNIPVVSLWTMSASVFSMFYHHDLFVENGHLPVENLYEKGESELATYIPGLAPIRIADLPASFHEKDRNILDKVLLGFSKVKKAQFLLFTSFFDLEPQIRSSLKSLFPFPVLSVGPLIPYGHILRQNQMNNNLSPTPEIHWLDSQPHSSVLYISLGSFLSVSPEQMDEIAAGLRDSGVNFIWVARGESSRLRSYLAGYSRGLVVEWCEQLRVLCHSSIGGFLSHCGWNSTMESIYAGVPILTFPLRMDQVPNSKLIVEDLKIGVRIKKIGFGRYKEMVKRETIMEIVKSFMDDESEERREMMNRVKHLKEMNGAAIQVGGSSQLDLQAFIEAISFFFF